MRENKYQYDDNTKSNYWLTKNICKCGNDTFTYWSKGYSAEIACTKCGYIIYVGE